MISRWTMTWLLLAAIAASGLLLACGEDKPSQPKPAPAATSGSPEPAPPSDIIMPPLPSEVGQRTITGELAVKIEMPDFYPADAPVYPNTAPSKSFVKGDRINLMFGTPDSVEQVLDFLTDELPRLGWDNAAVQRMTNIVSIEATKPGREMTIVLTRFEGDPADSTLIAVSVTAD